MINNTITYIRLINRAFVKENVLSNVLELCDEHKIGVLLGNSANLSNGGNYIESIHLMKNVTINIVKFKSFIADLIPFMDLYNGLTEPYAYMEFSLKCVFKENETILNKDAPDVNVLVFKQMDKDTFLIKILDPKINPLLKLKLTQQTRISIDELKIAQEQQFAFVAN